MFKFKRKISIIFIMFLALSFTRVVIPKIAFADLSEWSFIRPVSISNYGEDLTNFQVSVELDTETLILDEKMNNDGGDIRFIDADGVTILNYWIESGMNTISTKIWIRIPAIPSGNKTIYIYYGNSSVSSQSNGDNVFDFFDDFLGNSIDIAKWTPICQSTDIISSVSDSKLRISGSHYGGWWGCEGNSGDSYESKIIYSLDTPFVIEWSINPAVLTRKSESRVDVHGDNKSIGYKELNEISCSWRDGTTSWVSNFSNFECGVYNPGYHRLKMINNGQYQEVIDNGISKVLTINGEPLGNNIKAYICAKASGGTVDLYADFVFVRKYASSEPTIIIGEEELNESIITAIIDINPNTLNLKSQGKYITSHIELSEEYNVNEINGATIHITKINGQNLESPLSIVGSSQIEDYDENGILDLMVKFDRQQLIDILEPGQVVITVTGELFSGKLFEGNNEIRVIDKGKK